ncbi:MULTISPECIES: DUF1190 domain-containing protein [Citrobacter]|uniref:DUF1190 domain-containing protein n=1 Tax=Citrobacter werkmanii TaxID=67827 RepID=A0AA38DTV6_9ENTR|nr:MULTISPECIES: DUF1190 domain-containing protein [Citrobacter]MDN8554035.1 DUF1190 domain-containing protein [Citrobacter werkmanii]MDT0639716.1 DUF1190 domain-containing protein [Citrobacter werkmanii]MEC3946429.1 DUF1190 domain-containing protein [Citrobacter werkmanii]TKU13712.1 DUF1190 domain-containing protein [Citrobacter sp. TBCS-15]HAT7593565.1 DUF1190 domain-containing protein [Citrobacter werkmanii]
MARKSKSGNKNRTPGHSAITRIGRPVDPFAKKRSRYSGKYLTLAIMGGAAFFIIKGCSDSGDNDNDGDGVFYSTIQDCIADNNEFSVCIDAWSNAKNAFNAQLPQQMNLENCQRQFDNCSYDNALQSWVPAMSGFLLSRAIRKDRDEQYVYTTGGSSYVSRPVWRTTSGDYSWRSGSGKNDTATSHSYTTKKVSTVSRGGYGRSSSARGHWGG